MRVFDLSHTITEDIPVYPGTAPPKIEQANTLERNGFAEKRLTFFSHVGTHIDGPAHILPQGPCLDDLAAEAFVGRGICLKVSTPQIDADFIRAHMEWLPESDFVLFKTGWSRFWGSQRYFSGYPVLDEEAAHLLRHQSLKGIGFDTISADNAESESLPIHRILLQNMIIIENLTNLESLPPHPFFFSCLPLPIQSADGSPVRAVAIDFGADR